MRLLLLLLVWCCVVRWWLLQPGPEPRFVLLVRQRLVLGQGQLRRLASSEITLMGEAHRGEPRSGEGRIAPLNM